LTLRHQFETLVLANNGTLSTYLLESIMIEVDTVSIDVENIKNQHGEPHANGKVCVTVYCADMADLMCAALGRYTSVQGLQSLDWWFHDSGSVECYQCVSGTVEDLFDWLAHVLMMADRWCPQRPEMAESYRQMATLIGDSLLRHWLAHTVGSDDMGLNAEWNSSAFLVEPDATLASLATQWQQCGAAWLLDDETGTPYTWSIVRRWAPDESGRGHVAGLPFPQSVYDHADRFRATVPTCGEDYFGQERAGMSAPAAYAEVSRRFSTKAPSAPAVKRPDVVSSYDHWVAYLRTVGFPAARVSTCGHTVVLCDEAGKPSVCFVMDRGVDVSVWATIHTGVGEVNVQIDGDGASRPDEIDRLLASARALIA
jgi:hypothetical protein